VRLNRDNTARLIGWLCQYDALWTAMGMSRVEGWQRLLAELDMRISVGQFTRACRYARTIGKLRWVGRSHRFRGRDYQGQALFDFKVSA
jgi:hypothetical protein